jgi:mRNA interferase RelE/StbE
MDKKKVYKLIIKKSAEKFLENLSEPHYSTLKTAILELQNNPRPFGYKKLKGTTGCRIRVGNYRIVYEIHDSILTVEVINAGHRKNIYG